MNDITIIKELVGIIQSLPNSWLASLLLLAILMKYVRYMYDIEHYYTARFMRYTENKLDSIIELNVERFEDIYNNWGKGNACALTCVFPKNTYESALNISMWRLKDSLKQMRRENGYHQLASDEYDEYLNDKAKDLLTLSRKFIKVRAYGLKRFLDDTDDLRFSHEEVKKILKDILDFDRHEFKKRKKDLKNIKKFITMRIGENTIF